MDSLRDTLIDPPQFEGSETILLADDDPTVRSVIERALDRFGYTVLATPGGNEALRSVREYEGTIDLLLTDIMMPGMNGVELAQEVERLRPEVRIFYMSAYADEHLLREGLLTPGTHFIQKPFTPRELGARIREILDA